ncbi:MAG: hypothetical protein LH647_22790 [Leptolyngbyaceae cyanobacterium CAN_BIN12]|nr:hypothetical protein [Leptolyngbyaceae cyanobacterium CAN_BIN12]
MDIASPFPQPFGFVLTATVLFVLTDFTGVGGVAGDNFAIAPYLDVGAMLLPLFLTVNS